MALTLTIAGGTFHLSANPIRCTVTGASVPSGATDYKVLLKITSVDGLLIGGPFIDAIAPVSGTAVFDASGWVDQAVDKVFEFPLAGLIYPREYQTLDVKFTPGQRYIDSDGELQESWEADSETHYIVKGGVSFRELGRYYDESSSFFAEYVGKKFITRMPSTQVVHPFQPVKLWFLSDADKAATFKIKAYWDDDSYYEKSWSFDLYVYIIHEFNVLPYLHDSVEFAPVKAGAKMLYYEAWINGITAKHTFIVDHTYHENCNYLFFANSQGGVDVFWLAGHVKKDFASEKVEAVRPWPAAGTKRDRTVIVSSRVGRNAWKINTGWKSRDEMNALSDMLCSRQAWLLEDAATYNTGNLYPVTVTNSNSTLFDSKSDAQSLELDLVEGHNNTYI